MTVLGAEVFAGGSGVTNHQVGITPNRTFFEQSGI